MQALASRFPALGHLNFGWRDALDIAVVAIITYALLRLIRGEPAAGGSPGPEYQLSGASSAG